MTISWPPYGRWAAGYGTDEEALTGCRSRTIAGKVGYALPPGGHPELAAGFALSVASTSKNKEAAYLFIQWLNSEEISLQRVQLPYALRDPFRDSHFTRPGLPARCGRTPRTISRRCRQASKTGCSTCRCSRPTSTRKSLRQAISKLWAGEDPKAILDDVAERVGRDHRARSASTSRRPSMTPGRRSRAPIRSNRAGTQLPRRRPRRLERLTTAGRLRLQRTRRGERAKRLWRARPSLPGPALHDAASDRTSVLLVAPAIFVLLLIGLFPLVYSLVVSFQSITMTDDGHVVSRGCSTTRSCSRTSACGRRCCTR